MAIDFKPVAIDFKPVVNYFIFRIKAKFYLAFFQLPLALAKGLKINIKNGFSQFFLSIIKFLVIINKGNFSCWSCIYPQIENIKSIIMS